MFGKKKARESVTPVSLLEEATLRMDAVSTDEEKAGALFLALCQVDHTEEEYAELRHGITVPSGFNLGWMVDRILLIHVADINKRIGRKSSCPYKPLDQIENMISVFGFSDPVTARVLFTFLMNQELPAEKAYACANLIAKKSLGRDLTKDELEYFLRRAMCEESWPKENEGCYQFARTLQRQIDSLNGA